MASYELVQISMSYNRSLRWSLLLDKMSRLLSQNVVTITERDIEDIVKFKQRLDEEIAFVKRFPIIDNQDNQENG
jgi:hypothetical protein